MNQGRNQSRNNSNQNKNTSNNNSGTGQRRRNNKNSKRPSNRRPRNNNRRGPQLSLEEKAMRNYYNLFERYLQARKKYFGLFHRADPRQLEKLEKSFNRHLNELREFEEGLSPEFKELFKKKFDGHKLDHTYTENHELPVEGLEISMEETDEDPHYLVSQKESVFSEDTEESQGSFEDYQLYKGV
jgi:hypothetical protein